MATISELLTIIKNAVYGKDMRRAIHDSIEMLNENLETYKDDSDSSDNSLQKNIDICQTTLFREIENARLDAQTNLQTHSNASMLDHPDGSVTSAKIADSAITENKLADNAVSENKLSQTVRDEIAAKLEKKVVATLPSVPIVYDFSDGVSVFTSNSTRMTAAVEDGVQTITTASNTGTSRIARVCFDFSDISTDAKTVTIEYDSRIDGGRWGISLVDMSMREAATGASIDTVGSAFWHGTTSNSIYYINGLSNGNWAPFFGQMVHVKVEADIKNRTLSYSISASDDSVTASGNNVSFIGTAEQITGIEFYSWVGSNTAYIDNISITAVTETAENTIYMIADGLGNYDYYTYVGNQAVRINGIPATIAEIDEGLDNRKTIVASTIKYAVEKYSAELSGCQWFTGTDMNGTDIESGVHSYASADAKVGDYYLNTENGNLYLCVTEGIGDNAKWTYKGCIKGADASAKKTSTLVIGTTLSPYLPDEVDYLCDGTNDEEVFQSAINALPTSGGKIVVREGEYAISSALSISSRNVIIEGMGNSTKINITSNISIANGSGLAYQNCLLNFSRAGTPITFITGDTLSLKNCKISVNIESEQTSFANVSNATMTDCEFTYELNKFTTCSSVFYTCGNVKISDCDISLSNNASTTTTTTYNCNVNLIYDGRYDDYEAPTTRSLISNCNISCKGVVSSNGKYSRACISRSSGTMITNCRIVMDDYGSFAQTADTVDADHLSSISNCDITLGSTEVYLGCPRFIGNRLNKSSKSVLYFASGSIVTNNDINNMGLNDMVVYNNGTITFTNNRVEYECELTTNQGSEYVVIDNNVYSWSI